MSILRPEKWLPYTVEGTIIKLTRGGTKNPDYIKVKYCVDGRWYTRREQLTVKHEPLSLFGCTTTPVLPDTNIGAKVVVCYNPKRPKKSYLRDNDGSIVHH